MFRLLFLLFSSIFPSMTSFTPSLQHATTSLSILKQLNVKDRTVILASGSPRRKELLSLMGIAEFLILKSDFAEDLNKDLFTSSDAYCLETAQAKANDVVKKLELEQGYQRLGTVLIGADTIVEINNKILEKPANEVEAANMIRELSGAWHTVHTGVCIFTNQNPGNNTSFSIPLPSPSKPPSLFSSYALCIPPTTIPHVPLPISHLTPYAYPLLGTKSSETTAPLINTSSFITSTRVKFLSLSEEDIAAYVETRDGFDKAGGYGIQSIGGQMVEKIDGCYFNVSGITKNTLID